MKTQLKSFIAYILLLLSAVYIPFAAMSLNMVTITIDGSYDISENTYLINSLNDGVLVLLSLIVPLAVSNPKILFIRLIPLFFVIYKAAIFVSYPPKLTHPKTVNLRSMRVCVVGF